MPGVDEEIVKSIGELIDRLDGRLPDSRFRSLRARLADGALAPVIVSLCASLVFLEVPVTEQERELLGHVLRRARAFGVDTPHTADPESVTAALTIQGGEPLPRNRRTALRTSSAQLLDRMHDRIDPAVEESLRSHLRGVRSAGCSMSSVRTWFVGTYR